MVLGSWTAPPTSRLGPVRRGTTIPPGRDRRAAGCAAAEEDAIQLDKSGAALPHVKNATRRMNVYRQAARTAWVPRPRGNYRL